MKCKANKCVAIFDNQNNLTDVDVLIFCFKCKENAVIT